MMRDARMRREKTLILSSVQGRRAEEDRTELGPRPFRPILWDRRSRFSPVDRHSVGLCPSLCAPISKMNTIRILISMAAQFNWPLLQYDVKNAP